MDTVETIVTSVFEINRIMRQRMLAMNRREAKGKGSMNFLQLHSLFVIAAHEGMTMKEFAEALMVTSPTATSFVNRLVNLKWVRRVPDPTNRKLVRLKITDAGQKLLKEKMRRHKAAMKDVFGLVPTSDRDELARIMRKLHSLLASSQTSL